MDDSDLLAYSAEDVAKQMCLIEQENLSRIQIREFLNQAWNSLGNNEKAPNILRIIHSFGQVSNLVAGAILQKSDLQDRIHALSYFIQLAKVNLELV